MSNNTVNDNSNGTDFHPAETTPLEKYRISPVKNFVAMLVALLFIVIAGYLAYKYFLKSGIIQTNNNGEITSGVSTVRTDYTNYGVNEQNIQTDEFAIPGENKTVIMWVANDYKFGDIKQGDYNVKSGDTLWEIAEAVYGDGSQWVKIQNTNQNSIGFTAGGQQSLIYSGQTLVIP